MRIDRLVFVVDVELRSRFGQIDIRFVKTADRSDIFPITVEDIRIDFFRFYRCGDYLFSEIGHIVVEHFIHDGSVEDIDTHRREIFFFRRQIAARVFRNFPIVDIHVPCRLFHKFRNAVFAVDLHNAEARRVAPVYRRRRNRHVGTAFEVRCHKGAQVHAVQLIA